MSVSLKAVSTKPITLPCVFTGVIHIASFLSEFGKKRGVGSLGIPDPPPTCPGRLIKLEDRQ